MNKLQKGLSQVDQKVSSLKKTFEVRTTEAAKLKVELEKEQETIEAAENLVGKLEGEYQRWSEQVLVAALTVHIVIALKLNIAGHYFVVCVDTKCRKMCSLFIYVSLFVTCLYFTLTLKFQILTQNSVNRASCWSISME